MGRSVGNSLVSDANQTETVATNGAVHVSAGGFQLEKVDLLSATS